MRLPNQFLIYVSDAASAAAFYGELFDAKPEVLSPRYMTFDLGGGVVLALWSGKSRDLDPRHRAISKSASWSTAGATKFGRSTTSGWPRESRSSKNPTKMSSV
ncbi:hypothetical protein [Rhodococcus qingshengii]|uniref:hypothetical protein n=1 Tax=Rhodococcus qingshengii TaxID=334542 RepID=UPI00211DB64B|nr:hypothetical protein [Rhodococcus qingshengii]